MFLCDYVVWHPSHAHFLVFSGVNSALGAEAARWCKKEEEEVLHHPQEEQAQEEEGQARRTQILQGKNATGDALKFEFCVFLVSLKPTLFLF